MTGERDYQLTVVLRSGERTIKMRAKDPAEALRMCKLRHPAAYKVEHSTRDHRAAA